MLLTAKEEKQLKSALKKVEKCSGDCKYCEKFHAYFASDERNIFCAFGCDLLPKNIFSSISDSVFDLKNDAIEALKFELR